MKIIKKQEQYLIFALSAISDILFADLLNNVPFARTKWRTFGFSAGTLDRLRPMILEHKDCFQDIHRFLAMRTNCPDPPCPDEEWIGRVCDAGLAAPAAQTKSRKTTPKRARD